MLVGAIPGLSFTYGVRLLGDTGKRQVKETGLQKGLRRGLFPVLVGCSKALKAKGKGLWNRSCPVWKWVARPSEGNG